MSGRLSMDDENGLRAVPPVAALTELAERLRAEEKLALRRGQEITAETCGLAAAALEAVAARPQEPPSPRDDAGLTLTLEALDTLIRQGVPYETARELIDHARAAGKAMSNVE